MMLTCVLVFTISVIYESLRMLRVRLLRKTSDPSSSGNETYFNRLLNCTHVLQSILHFIQIFTGYILMLIVMTYNVWLILAAVLGAGFGYFILSTNDSNASSTEDETKFKLLRKVSKRSQVEH
ncbi:high affinity copper uptake protein 1-like protein [Leptotrombidium deliense]|uniref:Copper transport protein n=1 Tax=Leptotrombidium deliense TaxID=299467 RepID=A0A443S6W8_9ACAR|nr:high affinity copper uptake protein 1-like protein [Leptotrombidium deliense]